jgi:hypothetical protein
MIEAGVTGNFTLYRLLAWVPFCQSNYALRDMIIYLPILVLWCLVWYLMYMEISHSRRQALFAMILLLFSDNKLGLHWSFTPLPVLVSFSAVLFLQVFAFLLFLKGKRSIAMVTLALTGYIHPANALSYGAVFIAIMVIDAAKKRTWRLLLPCLFFVLIMLPQMIYITSHSQGFLHNQTQYWKHLPTFASHVFLNDHFKNGYAYTLLCIALVLVGMRTRAFSTQHSQTLTAFIIFSLAGCGLWIANVYFFHNLSILFTYFITRVFYIVKPILIVLLVQLIFQQYQHQPLLSGRILCVLFCATIIFISPTLAFIIATAFAGYVISPPLGIIAGLILAGLHLTGTVLAIGPEQIADHAGMLLTSPASFLFWLKNAYICQSFTWFEISCLLIVCVPILVLYAKIKFRVSSLHDTRKLMLPLVAMVVAVVLFQGVRFLQKPNRFGLVHCPDRNYGLDEIDKPYNDLVDWAKHANGCMFVVPPLQNGWFWTFRYLSKKSIYIQAADLEPLSYAPDFLEEGYKRFELLGVLHNGELGVTNAPYDTLSVTSIKKTNADYIVFDRRTFENKQDIRTEPCYQNDRYVVYEIKNL